MGTRFLAVLRCTDSKRILTAISAVLIGFMLGISPQPVLAQSGVDAASGTSAVFQLEGNAITDAGTCFGIGANGPVIATPGNGNTCSSVGGVATTFVAFASGTEDWDKIYAGTSVGSTATDFVADKFNTTADDQFTGGSTKDTNDFSQWLWGNGKPQAKDDFEHGYAAAYLRASDQHLILVAGVDRYSNSGSSTAGFWFTQDPNTGNGVTSPTACPTPSGCTFGGTHKDGDLLIISQFTTGGTVSTIQAFHWSGNGAGGSLSAADVSGTQCDPRSGSAVLCGTVNGVPVLSGGWTFASKSSDATSCSSTGTGSGTTAANCMSTGEFLEVGLDVTQYAHDHLGGTVPCISRFFAESRSSGTGVTSTLSDLIRPTNFNVCSITATKTCTGASINSAGTAVTYSFGGTITAKGGSLTNVSIADNPNGCGYQSSSVPGTVCSTGNPAKTISNLVLNQPTTTTLAPGQSATYSGSFDANFTSTSFDNLAQASGTTPENVTLTGPAAGASWLSGNPKSNNCAPAVSGCLLLDKTCASKVTGGNPLAIEIDFSGNITNNTNVQVDNITITDSPTAVGSITITCGTGCTGSGNGSFNLAPGGTASYKGKYTESGSSIICDPADSGRCTFTDTVTASGTGELGAGAISSCTPPATATCSLCPNGTCSSGN